MVGAGYAEQGFIALVSREPAATLQVGAFAGRGDLGGRVFTDAYDSP